MKSNSYLLKSKNIGSSKTSEKLCETDHSPGKFMQLKNEGKTTAKDKSKNNWIKFIEKVVPKPLKPKYVPFIILICSVVHYFVSL